MSRDLDGVLAAIDGALADDEWPDAMRWSPEPEAVDEGVLPFDGQHVTVGTDLAHRDTDLLVMHHATRGGVRWGTTPGGMYRGPGVEHEVVDEQVHHHDAALPVVREWRELGRLVDAPAWSPRALDPVEHLPVDDGIVDELHLVDPAHRAEVEARRAAVRARLAPLDLLGEATRMRCELRPVYPIAMPRQQGRGPALAGLTLDEPFAWGPVASRLAAEQARRQHEADLARLCELLTLSPEQLARMGRLVAELGDAMRVAAGQVARTLADLVESFTPVREHLVDTGVLPDEGPRDPRERALWLRRNRNTGPQVARAQAARRPRRHA